MNHFGLIINLLASVMIMTLGFMVRRKKPDSPANVNFFLMSLFFATWLNCNFLENYLPSLFWAKLFLYLDFAIAPFLIYYLFLFFCNFPYPNKVFSRKSWLSFVLALPIFAISALTLLGFIIKDPAFHEGRLTFFHAQLYHIYAFIIIIYGLSGSTVLIRRHNKASGRVKMQIRYVLFSFSLTLLVLAIFNLFLQNFLSREVFQLSGYASLLMLGATAYVMTRHSLMDIKLVVREPVVYLFAIWTIVMLDLVVFINITEWQRSWQFAVDTLIVAISLLSFNKVKDFYYYLANRYFFYTLYDTRKVVSEVGDKLISTINLKEASDLIYQSFYRLFRLDNFCLLRRDSDKPEYYVAYKKNLTFNVGKKFLATQAFEEAIIARGRVLHVDDIKGSFGPKGKATILPLIREKGEIIVPLALKGNCLGLMVLGGKESRDMYTDGDIKLLQIISSQMTSAMENMKLYSRINSLNRTLEKKVASQTKEIKAKAAELETKNKNLEKLLQIKNEFLRVVNHQLNTPISIIKNSIFMVRNNSFSVDKGLSFIEEGTRRMEGVLSDFWRAFSVEGEGVKMSLAKVDMAQIAAKLVDSASSLDAVKSGRVKVSMFKPASLPSAKTDPIQISQVLGNLLDNAITYTSAGSVKVRLEADKSFLKIYISDTGQGIDKKDVPNLFEKFYRTERAKKFRPGGSGLGLYIAKRIVEANNGQLRLEKSEVGKGSTFSLTLPIWKTSK